MAKAVTELERKQQADARRAAHRAHNELVKAILEHLTYRGIMAWNSKTQGQYDPARKVFRKFTGLKGVSDVTALIPSTWVKPFGRTLFVEVKTGVGKLSKEQKDFRDMVTAQGAYYCEAHRLDDVHDALTEIFADKGL